LPFHFSLRKIMEENVVPDFKEKIKNLPLCPGVYIMKDIDGRVIYVGKSKALKNRVSQYFQSSSKHSPKTVSMVSHINDFEYIITDNESEALALECNLIKKYRPKYNILLKDDKQYPYIKITSYEDFPRIYITRKVVKDGSLYFGPYMNSYSIKKALEVIKKVFMVRSCNLKLPEEFGKNRPCLYYHINQCCAPCTGKISKEEYRGIFDKISDVLKGNYKQINKELTEKMNEAAQNMEYEKAALLRDRIAGIQELSNEQKVTSSNNGNRDVIGIYSDLIDSCIQVFYIRGGKVVGSEHFTLKNNLDTPQELLEEFVKQFYFTLSNIPPEIVIPFSFEDLDNIENWLSERADHRVRFTVPKKGEKLNLLNMVIKNAEESLKLEYFVKNKDLSHQNKILKGLSELLNLESIPHRIECYDISNIAGSNNIGAQIVYKNAVPQKKAYRLYNIKNIEGSNDYECMKQTIFRRISEFYMEEDAIEKGILEKENAKFYPLPDLILLDGGIGHVSVIKQLLDGLGENIPVFGLVKDEKHKTRGIVDDLKEIPIDTKSDLFLFLTGVQEEVHRFAINHFRKKHEKQAINSELEKIPGVGPKKKILLLKRFKSVNKIKKTSIEELSEVVDIKTAENIFNYFNK